MADFSTWEGLLAQAKRNNQGVSQGKYDQSIDKGLLGLNNSLGICLMVLGVPTGILA